MRRIFLSGIVVCAAVLAFWVFYPSIGSTQSLKTGEIILFTGKNFSGRKLVVHGTLLDLPSRVLEDGITKFTWNDNIRSMVVVSGTWRLYQHGRCNTALDDTKVEEFDARTKRPVRGWSTLVSARADGPWEIPDVESGGFDEDISSIELVSEENLPDWALLD